MPTRGRVSTLAVLVAFAFSAVLCGVLVLVSCFNDRSLDVVQRRGEIRIGYAVEAPYAYLTEDGRITGESPQVAREIVRRLGIDRIDWIQTEFGSLINGLNGGRYDVIAAGMYITPERAELVSFSLPTFHVSQGLLVSKGNPYGLHAYEDALTTATIKLSALSGSIEERLLLHLGLPQSSILSVPDALSGRVSVETGLSDGLALSAPTLRWMGHAYPSHTTELAVPFAQPDTPYDDRLGYGAFAFRHADKALRAAWNKELADFVGSPRHRELMARFGFSAADLPGDVEMTRLLEE